MTQAVERIVVRAGDRVLDCRCFATPLSRALFTATVRGQTYPRVAFVRDVATVVDVGANIGAAALHFALAYPAATVHALEPAGAPRALLQHNAAHFPRIRVYGVGLYRDDRFAALHQSATDSVTASVGRSVFNTGASETVELRRADAWLAEQGLARIDVLKLDTEGCEVAILESLRSSLAGVRIVYVEYHSEADRLRIDELLHPTHVLVAGHVIHAHRGEFCYVARAAFPPGQSPDERQITVSL